MSQVVSNNTASQVTSETLNHMLNPGDTFTYEFGVDVVAAVVALAAEPRFGTFGSGCVAGAVKHIGMNPSLKNFLEAIGDALALTTDAFHHGLEEEEEEQDRLLRR